MSGAWNGLLPKSLTVGGVGYKIRSDYREILDICAAVSDPGFDAQERAFVALSILFVNFESMPQEHYKEAVDKCHWFINGGDTPPDGKQPKLMDWGQDFKHIIAPINRIMGREIRAIKCMHWWTFLSAYMEIGDCYFSQIVNIRNKRVQGKALDKSEQEFYRKNRSAVDLKTKYTEQDDAALDGWMGK